MAARNLTEPRCLDREVVQLFGGFTGADTSAPTSVVGAGVTSISRTGTGTYRITLTDKWNKLLFPAFTVISSATADDYEVMVSAETVSSTKLVDIAVFKGGTAADLQTTDKLKFMLVLSHTSQPPTAR